MGVTERLRETLERVPAVDHHAHLLAGADAQVDLTALLSEAADPELARSMRDHPSYARAVRDLGGFLGVEPDERAIHELRSRAGFEAYARKLFAGCGFAEVLVDDGLPVSGAPTLQEQAGLMGCPARRILRIETTAEAAAAGEPDLGEVRARFRDAVGKALDAGAAGMKTIAAYRAGLDLPGQDPEEAMGAYRRWRDGGSSRLTGAPLVSYFLHEALDVVRERPVPLQVHTGFGDTDLALHRSDPSLLRPLLEDRRYAEIPIVLLHCYPFIRQASYLAGVYPNVYLDLSLALTFAAHRGPDLLLEALDFAPASKLLFATDASRGPELFYLGARWWRDALAGALAGLCTDGLIDEAAALRWAEMILAGNARRIYG